MEELGRVGWFLLSFILMIMLIAFIFYSVRSFFNKSPNDHIGHGGGNKNIEQKLDRIIELLEKEKNDH